MIPRLVFNPPVIAHRGAGLDAPENTLSAIREAYNQGARWVEVDVKITYDGIPVLMHDETLDRTTNGTGPVAAATWETISRLDAGASFDPRFAGEKVPMLADVIREALACEMSVMIEVKPCEGRTRATTMVTIIELAKAWPENAHPPVISSFDRESLEIAAQMQPHWPRCLLLDEWTPHWQKDAEALGVCAFGVNENQLTPSRVKEFVDYNVQVLAYTLVDPARAKELLAWGVTAVYADNPRQIIES